MSKKKKKRGLSAINLSARTRVIIGVAVGVVAVLVIVAVVLGVLASKTKQPTGESAQTELSEEQKRLGDIEEAKNLLSIAKDAQAAMERGDSDRVRAIYDAEIKNTTDKTRKIKLYLDESRMYVYGSKYDKAIKAAKDAEAVSEDKYLAASQLAQVYKLDEQYEQAAKYYELAGQSVGSPHNTGSFTKEYYDKQAITMRSLAEGDK